jgi:hypothetical protein
MNSKEGITRTGGGRDVQKLWVPIVLIIGFVFGELISFGTTTQGPPGPGGGASGSGPFGYFHPFPTDPLFGYHIVFTTIEMALLVSLVIIYTRMYVETKANFALGLVAVLGALLVQGLLSYPILDDLIGQVSLGPGFSSPAADLISICAYTVFLYISLE